MGIWELLLPEQWELPLPPPPCFQRELLQIRTNHCSLPKTLQMASPTHCSWDKDEVLPVASQLHELHTARTFPYFLGSRQAECFQFCKQNPSCPRFFASAALSA